MTDSIYDRCTKRSFAFLHDIIGVCKDILVIEYTTDINARHSELRPKDAKNNKKLNGKMVIPDPLDGHIYVLVSSTLIGGKMLETTIHEMIHAYDYYSFAKKYCGGNCTIIDAHPFFHSFHYYSEFHAKSMGLKIFSTPEECEFFRKEVIPYFDKKIEHYCESGSAYEIVRIISEIHSKKEFMSTDEQYELIRSLFANHNYEDIVKLYVIFDSMFDEYNSDYNDEINAICEKIYKK